jgi:TPR repeat protein
LRRVFTAAIAAFLLTGAAIAQEGPPSEKPDAGEDEEARIAAPHQDDAGRLIMYARKLREEKGCAEAAPAYRVIAGMGEGQEAAQHELGECLLDMTGANATETALFRQEGVFWLTRAAYAGNARAQRKLAISMASPANALHDPKQSLEWSLVYQKNPTADLYGYGPLPPTMIPGLKSSLTAEDVHDAEQFAADFVPLPLAKFEGPARNAKRGSSGQPRDGGRPPRGRRPGVAG